MYRHVLDTPRSPSRLRMKAFMALEREARRDPSRVAQFRKAGKTIRSMRLREFLRIDRQQAV